MSLITLDPKLRPEYSHSATLSADWYRQFGKWEVNLTAEGFYTYLQDIFMLRENGTDAEGNLLFVRTNAEAAWVGGLNIEGKVNYGTLVSFQIGYTYQQSRYTHPQQWSPSVAANTRMLRTPDYYGYVLLDVKPIKDFTISINGKQPARCSCRTSQAIFRKTKRHLHRVSGTWESAWHTIYICTSIIAWRSAAA